MRQQSKRKGDGEPCSDRAYERYVVVQANFEVAERYAASVRSSYQRDTRFSKKKRFEKCVSRR